MMDCMDHLVIGLIAEGSDRIAVDWGIARAQTRPTRIRLISGLDSTASNPTAAKAFLADTAKRIQDAAPGTEVETVLADRAMLAELIEQSSGADLVVVPSHPDPAIRDGRSPSLPISLAARADCPVVIVPDDWQPSDGPVVIGVEAGGEQSAAVDFAAREAGESGRELRLVHSWESWKTLDARADQVIHGDVLKVTAEHLRSAFPALRLRAVLEEATAHDGVIANSRDAHLIVLGTHRIGRETGVVLGVIHQEVMIRGGVPLCSVPV
jgi:nucleotide-binding universal stress UspA family protein